MVDKSLSGEPPKRGATKKHKKKKSCKSFDLQDFVRRERDSNPRYLSVRRFSRPVQSTTLPSLLTCYASHGRRIAVLSIRTMPYCFCGCKVRAFCWFLQIFPQLFCPKGEKRRIKAPKGGFRRGDFSNVGCEI